MPQDLVNIRSSCFPDLCVGGEGDSVKSKVAKKVEKCATFRKAAEKGIHLVVEVTKETWRTVDHHNGELDRKGDSDSVEFKCRSGQVF